MADVPVIGHSVAVPLDTRAQDKDTIGFTNPNLHRRIRFWSNEYELRQITSGQYTGKFGVYLQDDSNEYTVLVAVYSSSPGRKVIEEAIRQFIASQLPGDELKSREYELAINGVHSYRTTKINTHDEESTTTELP